MTAESIATAPISHRREGLVRSAIPLLLLVGVIGLGGVLGSVSGSSPVLGVAAASALLLGLAMTIRPDIAVHVVVAVIYSNAAVIAVQFHGVPAFATVAVPLLLVVPVANWLLVRREPVVVTSAFPLMIAFFLV